MDTRYNPRPNPTLVPLCSPPPSTGVRAVASARPTLRSAGLRAPVPAPVFAGADVEVEVEDFRFEIEAQA